MVLYDTYPMMATLISVLFLNIKITNLQIITYVVCFFSIFLISKPAFFFPSKNDLQEDTAFGVFLTLICMFLNSIGIVLSKKIATDFDFLLSLFLWFFFLGESFLIGIFQGN